MIRQAVILSAGLGTRLLPLTHTVPKAMVRVAGKPLLEWHIERFRAHGVTDICINTHHLPDVITDYFGDGQRHGVRITYAHEPTPLGTAGALPGFRDVLHEYFFVIYGDIFSKVNYSAFSEYVQRLPGASGAQRVSPGYREDADLVTMDTRGKITAVHPKPHQERMRDTYMMKGITILKKDVVQYIPLNCYYELGRDLFPTLLQQGHSFYGYQCDEYSKGIDTVEKLQEVEAYLQQNT